MIRAIWTGLRRPDAQSDDWYGWATNQLSHGVVGMVLVLALRMVLPGPVAPLAVPLLYYLVWERWIQRGPDGADSLVDTLHVTAGATLIVLALAGLPEACLCVVGLWALALIDGIRRRLPRE